MLRAIGGAITGAARFLYGFVVGDDWRVAVVMLLALAATAFLVAGKVNAWWLVPLLAVVMTGLSLRREAGKLKPASPTPRP